VTIIATGFKENAERLEVGEVDDVVVDFSSDVEDKKAQANIPDWLKKKFK
jgi:hypothetical protein